MRIDVKRDANRLQTQQMYGVAVKAIRDSHSDSHWVGSRSKDYPSFVVKTKRGYPNPPAFCHFMRCESIRYFLKAIRIKTIRIKLLIIKGFGRRCESLGLLAHLIKHNILIIKG
jgi:hypothetical protein